jgi:ankyrin repeat protein
MNILDFPFSYTKQEKYLKEVVEDGNLDELRRLDRAGQIRGHTEYRNHPQSPTLIMACITRNGKMRSRVGSVGVLEAVNILVNNGAIMEDIEASFFMTVLGSAIDNNDTAIVRFLLESGLRINETIRDGYSPLYRVRSREVAALLIEHGADINHQGRNGKTPLHGIVRCMHNAETTKYMIELGADVHATDRWNKNALFAARIDSAKLLIEHGININQISDPCPNTAAFEAVKAGSKELVELFYEHGADFTIECGAYSRTALQEAAVLRNRTKDICAKIEQDVIDHVMRERREAFAMGFHDRLGASSVVRHLSPDQIRMLLLDLSDA